MIGKLLGHTQVQTTARYAHLARDPVKIAGGPSFGYNRHGDDEEGEQEWPAKAKEGRRTGRIPN
jgi:hypothetical protein